jgi:hypothetical protein
MGDVPETDEEDGDRCIYNSGFSFALRTTQVGARTQTHTHIRDTRPGICCYTDDVLALMLPRYTWAP